MTTTELSKALPEIITEQVPGPKSKALLDRRDAAIPKALCGKAYPICIKQGGGAMFEDLDGNKFLDWVGGVGVLNIGYSNPEVIEAVKAQTEKYFHTIFNVYVHDGYVSLAEKLNEIMPCKGVKMGLADPAMVADSAVMITNMLDSLPYKIFATSSIDAMVHSVESFLSPNGCSISRIFSTEALKTILTCWKKSVEAGGEDAWKAYAADFLKASNWAGLGFGYAGCAAVHACAYPLGSVYHIPHGQSNQLMFKDVMKMYKKIKPTGRINDLEAVIAESLSVAPENALEELYALMDKVLKSAPLEEFGVKKSDLAIFAGDVIKTQQRLLRNNYVQLSEEQILEIYEAAY